MPADQARSFGLSVDITRVVYEANSPYQHILVADTQAFGRVLMLDGDIQSAQSDERIYHESFIHPAMVMHGNVKRVLVVGAGEGAVLRELLKHDEVSRILAVDIDEAAVSACREHLPQWSAGAFEDPRVELRFEDAKQTLMGVDKGDERFDLIVLDANDPIDGGPAEALYARRFYEQARACLAPKGLVVVQGGEVDPKDMEHARAMLGFLKPVFGHVQLSHFFVPSFLNLWGAYICANTQPPELSDSQLRARVEAISGELWVYSPTWHRACLHLPRLFAHALADG